MYCFYPVFYKTALLVLLLFIFDLPIAEACITPKPKIEGNDTVCENSVEIYSLNSSTVPDKIKVAVENGNTTLHIFHRYAEVKWHKPGFAYIKFIYTNKNGCTDSVTKQVYIKSSNFQYSAGPDVNVCYGDSVTIGKQAIPGFTYQWNASSDFVDNHPFFIGPRALTSTYTVKGFYSKFYKVVATDTNTGCRYVDTVWVKVNPGRKTKIKGETGCVNNSTTYLYETDSLPQYAYWYAEGGEILSDKKAKSVLVKWNRIGKNNLQLRYFTGSCNDSTMIETALSSVKQPFYAGPDVVACHRDSVILGMPPIPNCSYSWYDTRYIHLGLAESYESYCKVKAIAITQNDFTILYKVSIKDNVTGCSFIDTVKLTVKPRLNIDINAQVGCYNDIAYISTKIFPADAYWVAEGGEIVSDNKANPILVKWNRNGKNTVKLRYNLNGCTDSAVYVAEVDSLTHFPIYGADSIFENTTHTYSVENLSNTINKWKVNGGNIIAETENAITVNWGNKTDDAYIWSLKENTSGCSSDTAFLPISIKKRDQLDLSYTFHVYPNPFSNNIMIAPVNDFSGEITIVLNDILGRKLLEQNVYIQWGKNALTWNVDVAGLATGIYTLSITSGEHITNWKLVKE